MPEDNKKRKSVGTVAVAECSDSKKIFFGFIYKGKRFNQRFLRIIFWYRRQNLLLPAVPFFLSSEWGA